MNKLNLKEDYIIRSKIVGNELQSKYIQKGKVVFRINYTYDEPKDEAEAKHNQDLLDRVYDILFDEAAEKLKDTMPWLKRYIREK